MDNTDLRFIIMFVRGVLSLSLSLALSYLSLDFRASALVESGVASAPRPAPIVDANLTESNVKFCFAVLNHNSQSETLRISRFPLVYHLKSANHASHRCTMSFSPLPSRENALTPG